MTTQFISVDTTADEKLGVVTASATVCVAGHWVDAVGSARKHDPDRYDQKLGETLATARALREAADKLEKGARREIRRRDLRRARQEEIDEQRRIQRQANTAAIRARLAQQGILKHFTDIGTNKLSSV